MERILSVIKCVNCQLILNTPVLLPCGHSICKHHTKETNELNQIKCEKCGRDHIIPNEGLPENEPLAEIIASQVHDINLGEAHYKAKINSANFDSLVSRVNLILADPLFEMFEDISGIKNEVMLKREELKLKIDQEADKLIGKLDDYLEKYKAQLNGYEFQEKSNDLEVANKLATNKLNEIKNRFNQVVLDDTWWLQTSNEITNELKVLNERLKDYKSSLSFQSDLEELEKLIKNSHLTLKAIHFPNNDFKLFLDDSKIINTEDLKSKLIKVCEFKGKRNWELLYRGSEAKFVWTEFHAKCENKSPTLVIVKSNDGCIFGGNTKAAKLCQPDGSNEWIATDSEIFVFRLEHSRLESKKYKFNENKHNMAAYSSICLFNKECGPCFGRFDIRFISNSSYVWSTLNSDVFDPKASNSDFGVPYKMKLSDLVEMEVFQELNN